MKRFGRNTCVTLAGIGIGIGLFVCVSYASAQGIIDLSKASANIVMNGLIYFFGLIISWMVGIFGTLLLNFIYIMTAVAHYNQFLSSTAVTAGWVVIRDLVNMFFVIVLLAIAIGTILGRQSYHYSQALPKFLVAAVLVNFSKTICGLAIDAAQVVMMTFVGAISDAVGGNMAALLGIPILLKRVDTFITNPGKEIDGLAFGSLFLAFIFVVVALITVGTILAMLVIRIIALWFLIILSPAAFFLIALPNDRGYWSKWSENFINYLILGPAMMFFLWLSLSVVASQGAGVNDATQIQIATELGIDFSGVNGLVSHGAAAIGAGLGSTGISTIGGMAGYILGIGMLLASLVAAQQLASVGGGIAGAGAGLAKDWMTGKRGPSPMRYLRERGAAYGQILRKNRQEKAMRDAARLAEGVALVGKIPGRAVKRVGRGIYSDIPVVSQGIQRVHAWSQQRARTIDTVLQQLSGGRVDRRTGQMRDGWLGFGKAHQERLGQQKAEKTRLADDLKRRAARRHASAKEQEEIGKQNETVGNQAAARTAYQRAARYRAEAYRYQNQAENYEVTRAVDTARMALPNLTREALKLAVAGITAPIGGAAVVYSGDLQNVMESQSLAAAEALEGAMSSFISRMEKFVRGNNTQQVRAIAEGTVRGYSNMERAAAMRVLANRTQAAGGYRPDELEWRRNQYIQLINAHPVEIYGWDNDVANQKEPLPQLTAAQRAYIAAAKGAGFGAPPPPTP